MPDTNQISVAAVSETLIFNGSETSALLAPRGVYIKNNMLFVADTAQNRLFIWNTLPTSTHADPDIVLGQSAKGMTGRNESGKLSASSLFYPSGIWSDGQKLIVADAWNHRVLIWNAIPKQNGQAADVVVGQPNFLQNEPNVQGISADPTAQTLHWPYGVYSDGTALWIADTGNRRVLYFESIPNENYAAADAVIGKSSFNERDYNHESAIWPYSVKINNTGQMAITDTQYYRVLIWKDWKQAFHNKADVIIGQTDFNANGQNQFGWFPKANTLNWCYDTCFYKDGIWVADTGNSRLLWYSTTPNSNNLAAEMVIGQDDFVTGSENKNTIWSTEGSLYWPFQISIENNIMVIADTGNHRVVINTLKF